MVNEMLDILDENGKKTGVVKTKEEVYKNKYFIKTVHLWILNPKTNKILIQKRSKQKNLDPGKWDLSCGGYAISGEESKDAIIREVKEELGLDISNDNFIKLFTHKTGMYFQDVYFLEKNISIKNIKLQKEEVDDIRYFSIEELEKMYYLESNLVKHEYIPIIIDYIKEKNKESNT